MGAALMFLAAACSSGAPDQRVSPDTPPTEQPVTTAPASAMPPTAESSAASVAAAADATEPGPAAVPPAVLDVVVRDEHGHPVGAVPVDVRGPEDASSTSDGAGRIHLELPAGDYTVRVVPGCRDEIEVLDGETARAALVSGQRLDGRLWVTWRHRYVPDTEAHPSQWKPADGSPNDQTTGLPTWHEGVAYTVDFAVLDRCTGAAPAADATIATWKPVPETANVEVLDPGAGRADASGWARLVAKCTRPGVISLAMTDAANPDEQPIDLLARSNQGFGKPSCRRP